MMIAMSEGRVKGMFAMGQNPAVGGQNARFQRAALAKLDWLVVKDNFETETAAFWYKAPEVADGSIRTEDIQTEVFFFPSAQVAEMDGTFTNTQRLIKFHHKAVDPPGDCPLRHLVHLSPRPAAEEALRGQHRGARPGLPQPGLGLRARPGGGRAPGRSRTSRAR